MKRRQELFLEPLDPPILLDGVPASLGRLLGANEEEIAVARRHDHFASHPA